MQSEYEKTITYLESLPKSTEWYLERTKELFELANTPMNELKVIHVAGTNGKGSVSSFLDSILRAQGFKVGLDTSPALVSQLERIQVNRKQISEESFVLLFNEVLPAIKQMKDAPSFFEVMTLIAVKHFINEKVDYAVIEVGLGGRLDSTNVLQPILSVITNISLEHTQMLGSTIKEIAGEKAGIIKTGVPVVTGCSGEALEVIKNKTKEKNSEVVIISEPENVKTSEFNTEFIFENETYTCSLLGAHQAKNACIAIRAAKKLNVQEKSIKEGIETTFWPGRLEVISHNPLIVFDAAHNPAGTRVLVESVSRIWPSKNVLLVFGVMKDKNYLEMISELKKMRLRKVFTTKCKLERSENEITLAALFENATPVENVVDALQLAKKEAKENDLILVAGSIYVLGEVYSSLQENTFRTTS
ncbi:MAG: folylpolyglutamate synthase/dihydrofolate synthase family protein [Candidatus Micrarchaeota archaeon]